MLKLTATKLFIMQMIAHIVTVWWLFTSASLINFVVVFTVYFFTGCIGMTITYHRLLTHRSFVTSKFFEYFGTFCATVGLTGSSIAWTAAHRQHHRSADKPSDPHSPVTLGYIKAQWLSMFSEVNVKRSPVLSDKIHQFFHRYYLHINIVWAILLYILAGTWAVVNIWLVPACLLWNAGSLINTLCHTSWLGYRRYNVPDQSMNNPVLGLFVWGEGWHNNHHRFQGRPNIGERWYEVDIGYLVICLVRTTKRNL
jgi:fatty-acid desaturase